MTPRCVTLHAFSASLPASPKKQTTAMRLDPRVLDAMREYKRMHSVPLAAQIERGVTD